MSVITIPFKGIRYKGEHTPALEYSLNNVVSHPSTGVKYIAYAFDVPANISITDISYWKFYDDGDVQIAAQVVDNTSAIADNTSAIADNTSAIAGMMESGSNVHGDWIKMSDGTLWQYAKNKYYGAITANMLRITSVGITFPMAFVGEYGVSVDCNEYGNSFGLVSRITSHNPAYCRADFHLAVGTTVAAGDLRGGFVAIGRWK